MFFVWEFISNLEFYQLEIVRREIPKQIKKSAKADLLSYFLFVIENHSQKTFASALPQEKFLLKIRNLSQKSTETNKKTASGSFLFDSVLFVETVDTSVCLSKLLTSCVEWVAV